MKDFYHDTVFVSKLIHYGWNRVNRYKPFGWQERKLRGQCGFLQGKDKAWFIERLDYATVEVKDVDPERTLSDAGLVLNGKIEVVGGQVDVSGKVAWHTDFKNNYTWPKGQRYYKYQIVGPNGGRDVKTVWDLSRCHHLLWLAAAYRQTSEEKYAKRIVETIDDWIEDNPFGRSVNWVCPMDVAIRAVNWLFAVQMITASEVVETGFLNRLFVSFYQHGAFVYTHLEKSYPFSENHYAADITGLLFMGYLFDFNKNGKRWLDYALQSMLFEMRTQILPSGVHYERSVSYHRLVTEMFFYSYLIIRKNTPNYIAIDITYRIKTMMDFIASYTKPNDYAPLFADNDNGRLLPFVKRDYREHYYLVDLARAYGVIDEPQRKELFDDAGFAFLRNDKFSVAFTNTPTSRYSRPWRPGNIGTHTHLDALSFELNKEGVDFIVDAGAYTYTESKEVRREFRSMQKHNTMSVDGENPYQLSEDFGITPGKGLRYHEPHPIVVAADNNKRFLKSDFYWEKAQLNHSREICIDNKSVVVRDEISMNDGHEVTLRFHLDAAVAVGEPRGATLAMKRGNEALSLTIEANAPFDVVVENDTVSPAYGVVNESKTIAVIFRTNTDFFVKSIFN